MKKGKFIVLDGNDGSGKATQAKVLRDRLNGENIASVMMDFPGYDRNFFGALLAECLAGRHGDFVHLDPRIASALYALDRLESAGDMHRVLEEGTVVIADRFASSNQIHQGGKISDDDERSSFLGWLDRMEHEILKIPRPDLIIYLRVPVKTSLELLLKKRAAKNQLLGAGARDTVEEDRTYLERSHETANWLAAHQPNWVAVNCSDGSGVRSVEDIHADIRKIVDTVLMKD